MCRFGFDFAVAFLPFPLLTFEFDTIQATLFSALGISFDSQKPTKRLSWCIWSSPLQLSIEQLPVPFVGANTTTRWTSFSSLMINSCFISTLSPTFYKSLTEISFDPPPFDGFPSKLCRCWHWCLRTEWAFNKCNFSKQKIVKFWFRSNSLYTPNGENSRFNWTIFCLYLLFLKRNIQVDLSSSLLICLKDTWCEEIFY